jgi:hypothetical protein
MNATEARLISHYRPPFNIIGIESVSSALANTDRGGNE